MSEAMEFSTSKAYTAGEMVMYSGVLYKYILPHSAGAWNGSEVQAVDSSTAQELVRIIAGYNNAKNAAAYVGTIPFLSSDYSPDLITGTRYKFVLTNAADPR